MYRHKYTCAYSPVHAAVQAVVERRKQSLGADLLLRPHAQLPRQQRDGRPHVRNRPAIRAGAVHRLAAVLLVVLQHASRPRPQRVIVQREVGDAEQGVQLEELEQVQGLRANGERECYLCSWFPSTANRPMRPSPNRSQSAAA